MTNKKKAVIAIDNPIVDLIDDETYETLNSRGLLNKKAVQNYQVQKRFDQLIDEGCNLKDSIATLQKEFQFLDFSIINKLSAQVKKVER
jgi:hypothetical protein